MRLRLATGWGDGTVALGGGVPGPASGKTVAVAGAEQGIASRTLRGMAWAYGSYVGGRILVLLTIAILARLLTPSDFGLVAFATLVTGFLDTVSDFGVPPLSICVKSPTAQRYDVEGSWVLLTIRIGGAPRTPAGCGGLTSGTHRTLGDG